MRVLLLCLGLGLAGPPAVAADPNNPCSERGTDLYLMNKCNAQREAERKRDAERERDRSQPGAPQRPNAPPVVTAPQRGHDPWAEAGDKARKDATERLHRALLANDDKAIGEAFISGAYTHVPIGRGITPLMVAAYHGRSASFATFALYNFAGSTLDDAGNNALLHQVAAGDAPALGLLLKTPASLVKDGCNAEGWSALALAAALGKEASVQQLLERGVKPDPACAGQRVPALLAAAATGQAGIVARLLQAGADPAARGAGGLTAAQLLASRPAQEQVAKSATATVERMFGDMAQLIGTKASARRAPTIAVLASMPRETGESIASNLTQRMAARHVWEGARLGEADTVLRQVATGDAPELDRLLRNTPARQFKDGCSADGWSALSLAAALGKDASVQLLLRDGAQPDLACSGEGVPALLAAIATGRAGIVTELLQAGADPAAGRAGLTPVQMLAARPAQAQVAKSATATVERILGNVAQLMGVQAGALQAPRIGTLASMPRETTEAVRASLLKALATKDLFEGARLGQADTVRKALAAGANPRAYKQVKSQTPLVFAAAAGHIDTLSLLLSTEAASDLGLVLSALDGAARAGQCPALRLLLAEPVLRGEESRLPQLMQKVLEAPAPALCADALLAAGVKHEPWARAVLSADDVALLKVFVKAGLHLHAAMAPEVVTTATGPASERLYTPLMRASTRIGRSPDRPDMVRAIVDAAVDVNARTNLGRSALWYAAQTQGTRVIEVLLHHGADPNVADVQGGLTPLMLAAWPANASPQTVQLLLDAGADITATNRKGVGVIATNPEVQRVIDAARAARAAAAPTEPPPTAHLGADERLEEASRAWNEGWKFVIEANPRAAGPPLRRAVELAPTYYPYRNALVVALSQNGELDEARAHCQILINRHPGVYSRFDPQGEKGSTCLRAPRLASR